MLKNKYLEIKAAPCLHLNFASVIILILFTIISFSACCKETVNKNSGEDLKAKREHQMEKFSNSNISPGTAEIKAKLLTLVEEKDATYKIMVDTVFRYGSSIQPLPNGYEMIVIIPKELLQRKDKENIKLITNEYYRLLIQQLQKFNRDKVEFEWKAIEIF